MLRFSLVFLHQKLLYMGLLKCMTIKGLKQCDTICTLLSINGRFCWNIPKMFQQCSIKNGVCKT